MPKEAQRNIRVLRGWAKSKGWIRTENSEGGPEVWGLMMDGKISWRLKIKPEVGARVGLASGSQMPRFTSRLDNQGVYINPFNGKLGGKALGGHISLQNPLEMNFEENLSNDYTSGFRR